MSSARSFDGLPPWRTILHYRRMNLAVALGAAVASAVLTGALLVGDSVRGSLRQLTLERLGEVEHALAAPTFFPEDVADRLAASTDTPRRVAPAILLQGQAQHAETKARASKIGLQGVDERFTALFADAPEPFFEAPNSPVAPPAVINDGLATQLGAAVGDEILISLERWSDVPRGSLLGRKDTGSVVRTLRLEVVRILPDAGMGRFALQTHQSLTLNVFVPLAALQKALDQEGTANALLVGVGEKDADPQGEDAAEALDGRLQAVLRAADLGIEIVARGGIVDVESREFILKPTVEEAVQRLAARHDAQALPILTYLINRITKLSESEDGGASVVESSAVPYSTVTALDPARLGGGRPPFGRLLAPGGAPVTSLADDEILLNTWTADQLTAAPGDAVRLTYFEVGDREELREVRHDFKVAGIVRLEELGADQTLSQDYPGIADTDNMADWDPPFPIELGAVRPVDELYWDEHRGTPKAFVSERQGRELWRTRWGQATALRLAPDPTRDLSPEALAETLDRELPGELEMAAFGLRFQAVRAIGLGASSGATDFGGLFIGFSLFLIVSAALLAALLFQLGVEQRVGEIGLRRALGEPAAKVRRRLLVEGGVVAASGALVGLAGAVGYAALMMAGLRTRWLPAVGTSRLDLFVTPTSLAVGWILAVGVVLFAIWRTVRRVARVPTPQLLARVSEPPDLRPGHAARRTALVSLGLAAALLIYAVVGGKTDEPAIFFTLGPALLVGALALYALRLSGAGLFGGKTVKTRLPKAGFLGRLRMAAANSGRHRGRSLLSATLVAGASFLVVTVAAYQQDFSRLELGKDSGTGGYALIAESAIPLHQDLNDEGARFELGLPGDASKVLQGVHVTPLRLLPGDDTSCLNLYKPGRPRVLGVPAEQIARGGFQFAGMVEEVDNPWTLLDLDLGENVIPAIGDVNSTQWILKLGLGDDLPMRNEAGEEIRLRLVATLATSIFQSELLIPEGAFKAHFPSRGGTPYFLVDIPAEGDKEGDKERVTEVSRYLEKNLDAYGFDAVTTGEKLEAFHAVQNTFLETFRTLGGLGLLLGTLGLAVVLLRNVLERRGELAMLRAFGFRRGLLTWMVVVENGLLLLIGLGIGTAAALLTVLPHLLAHADQVPWSALGWTLGTIVVFGLAACTAASIAALRGELLLALKAEH